MVDINRADASEMCNEWNLAHPPGTAVEVTFYLGSKKRTVTRSIAWVLPSGHPAVLLEGISGCYSLTRVRALTADEMAGERLADSEQQAAALAGSAFGVNPLESQAGTMAKVNEARAQRAAVLAATPPPPPPLCGGEGEILALPPGEIVRTASEQPEIKVLYVAGPYRSVSGIRGVVENIRRAEDVALALWRMGAAVICPHMNTALLDGTDTDEMFLAGDLAMLARCDGVVMLPGWELSEGARVEKAKALVLGIPVFEWRYHRAQLTQFLRSGVVAEYLLADSV
jgi:hypothetical protein